MDVPRHSKITAGQLSDLASLANAAIPLASKSKTYAFGTSSWWTEYNTIREDAFNVLYGGNSGFTQSSITDEQIAFSSLGSEPRFVRDIAPAVSGPWILKGGSQDLVNGQDGWSYDEVEYWFTNYTQSQALATSAYFPQPIVLGNVLFNWADPATATGSYCDATRVEWLISSDVSGRFGVFYHTGSLRAYSGIRFALQVSGSSSGSANPNVTINTNIPTYYVTESYSSYGGGLRIDIPDQSLNPDLYYIEITPTTAGWKMWYRGQGTIGFDGYNDVMYFRVTSSNASTAVAINNFGSGTGSTSKIVAPKHSGSGGWSFGIFTQYAPIFMGSSNYYQDVLDGTYYFGNNNYQGTQYLRSSIKWSPIPKSGVAAPGYFIGKTIPLVSDGTLPIDFETPHTRKTTTDNYSAQQATSQLYFDDGTTSSIAPSLWYGVGQWPVLESSGSVTWSASLGQGYLINSILITRPPENNGEGVMLPSKVSSSYNVVLTYYSGSTKKILTTITVPSNTPCYLSQSFIPCFSQVPVVISSSLKPDVDLYVCNPSPYIGLQKNIGQNNLRIPWLHDAYYPVGAYHYNDMMNFLSALSASANQ